MSKPQVNQDEIELTEETIVKQAEKKPKRKCSEKQLAALAAGRAKNKRFKPKFLTE